MAASEASRFSAWAEYLRPFTIVVVASCRYTRFMDHGAFVAFAERINPMTSSNLASCNYSTTKEFHTTVTGRTGHQPTIVLAHTYVAIALTSD